MSTKLLMAIAGLALVSIINSVAFAQDTSGESDVDMFTAAGLYRF